MDSIFFERQEGALCAQHALNALLQGAYFTAVDLAAIARTLDAEERNVLGEAGVDNPDYLREFQHDSYNMDDTGFFSVQVISAALRVWNLRLIPFTADDPEAVRARFDPTCQNAYICNFREHWFTIRKFVSQQWFNLNSLLNGPELISPTYLHLFLEQLQRDGYSIFVVEGQLPQCQADVELLLRPTAQQLGGTINDAVSQSTGDDDPELAAALAMSLGQPGSKGASNRRASSPDAQTIAILQQSARDLEEDDPSLMEAIARSMADQDEDELKRALMLSMQDDSSPSTSSSQSSSAMNGNALEPVENPASSSTATSISPPNPADLRAKRAAFLDRLQKTQDSTKPQ